MSRLRLDSLCCVGLVVGLLVCLAPPDVARAQDEPGLQAPPAAKPTPEDFSKPMGPLDPLNRGTPRGSMWGFFASARSEDYERAAQYLDLRRLPAAQKEMGPELARRLKVILDRSLWVDLVNLSDTSAGVSGDGLPAWRDHLGEITTPSGKRVSALLQRVPREGDEVRIWKVSAETVGQIGSLYAEFEPIWLEDKLPDFFRGELLGTAHWKWVSLFLLAAFAAGLSLLIAGTTTRILGLMFTRGRERLDVRIVELVRGPVRLALAVIIFAVGHRSIGLSLFFVDALRHLERLTLVIAVAWLFFRLIDLAVLALRIRAERQGNLGVLPVLNPAARFGKIVIILIGVLGVLGTLGVNISAAVAGLGVGGIAVALAAQKSLENLFGGISLFADRPVRVGDFFRYGDHVGTVEEIGLRSTRVRTLDRTVVSIPNAEFSNLQLENFAKRDRLRMWTMLGVRYETTPDQLRYLLARLREILLAHPRVTDEPARVRFVGFGAYSLDIEVFAYIDSREWNEFLAIREHIYLLFMEAVKESGTGFAFPSTTTYIGRDEGLDENEIREAENRVETWRRDRELPFPDFSEDFRRENANRMEWPPEGSPQAPTRGPSGPDRLGGSKR